MYETRLVSVELYMGYVLCGVWASVGGVTVSIRSDCNQPNIDLIMNVLNNEIDVNCYSTALTAG